MKNLKTVTIACIVFSIFIASNAVSQPTGSIGNQIWNDADSDGVIDPGEVGIGSVKVWLMQNGITIDSTFTDLNGIYNFSGLSSGTYMVDVDESTLLSGYILTTLNEPHTVTLSPGRNYIIADFGYRYVTSTGSIGNQIWNDTNRDGVITPGEVGIGNVTVLLMQNGIQVGSTVTNANGVYNFTGFTPGVYSVDVDESTLPSGYTLTSINEPYAVTLRIGENYIDADFGYTAMPTGSMGNQIWNDTNFDGMITLGEVGIGNVTVLLKQNGVQINSTTTDGNGVYNFAGLAPGTYTVDVNKSTLPSGYILTTIHEEYTVTLKAGQNYIEADFGYAAIPTGSIGNQVWDDANPDGIVGPGEVGISNVVIALKQNGTTVTTDTTDGTGQYNFTGLDFGTYVVDVDESTLPPNYVITTMNEPHTVTLPPGQSYLIADFGYRDIAQTSSIGNQIWNDVNGDGLVSFNEGAIGNVKVWLKQDGIKIDSSVTSGGSGSYIFSDLDPGIYTVDVDESTLPAGYMITTFNEPHTVTLQSGQDNYLIADFGYSTTSYNPSPGTIGNHVWNDVNNNGNEDGGEAGIANVTVYLMQNGITIDADTTDVLGVYGFTAVTPGTYSVDVDESTLPIGYTLTTDNEPYSVTIASGQNYNMADFGYWTIPATGSIGNQIWYDANRNGMITPGEAGIGSVTVLLKQNGVQIGSTTTDGSGVYNFPGLVPGTYTVDVDESTLPLGYILTTINEPHTVTLKIGQNYIEADFGYWSIPVTSSIGNQIWYDANRDGIISPGEVGIGSVTVLLKQNGVQIGSTTTDGNGLYIFPGLAPGTYTVDVDESSLPSGYILTTINEEYTVTLQIGQNYAEADFGYWSMPTTSSIGNQVWDDANKDGIISPGEVGIGNVTVLLKQNGVQISSTTTNANGVYAFTGLASGIYTVEVDESTLPSGYILTTFNEVYTVTVKIGQNYAEADFGYWSIPTTSSIGDQIWNDIDGDGLIDLGEVGIANVTVLLKQSGVQIGSDTTNANGLYDFTGLTPGTFTVDVDESTLPSGYWLTSANEPHAVTVGIGSYADYNEADFGYQVPTGIIETDDQLPTKFALDQNYPNPFNPTTTIRFDLPETQHVTLKVFDMNGREVATLLDTEKAVGIHRIEFDASDLTTGVYLYKIHTEKFSASRTLLLIK